MCYLQSTSVFVKRSYKWDPDLFTQPQTVSWFSRPLLTYHGVSLGRVGSCKVEHLQVICKKPTSTQHPSSEWSDGDIYRWRLWVGRRSEVPLSVLDPQSVDWSLDQGRDSTTSTPPFQYGRITTTLPFNPGWGTSWQTVIDSLKLHIRKK